ncbi:Imm45 family immunity protein [Xanthomonas oryzae]|uniref:Imm45 family immunity protein n=1 Tax=Xanthomonas oryzae TaxID=347 RepID=UPI001A9EC3ED|nr:Imm45 family immunity protein [Xanthomonas oryzae]WVN06977.1 Imm45 family immunity protein [Xanthomonas oryzae pv. oryzicola]
MNWIKLLDYEGEILYRGGFIRVNGSFPYEKIVEFMLYETGEVDRAYGLIVVSGYKAGLKLVNLPSDSLAASGGVSKGWVISNWDRWIYPECEINDVYFLEQREIVTEN